MNTKISIFFTSLLFGVLMQGLVFSQEVSSFSKLGAQSAITASDYCQFLNSVATTDPDHLYDEKMSLSCSSLIARMGEPGNYHYEVIDGKEEIPITFISNLNATQYLAWLQDPSLTFIANVSPMAFDEQLQSTDLSFYLESISSMQQSSGVEMTISAEGFEELIGLASLLALGERGTNGGDHLEGPSLTHRQGEILSGEPVISNHLQEEIFPMNITRESSLSQGAIEDATNLSLTLTTTGSTEASAVGSLEEVAVAQVTSSPTLLSAPKFEGKFQNLPDDIRQKAIFFSSEMPSESEHRYGKQYKEALTNFQIKQTKNPLLAQQVTSWKEAQNNWLFAKEDLKEDNIVAAYQNLQAIEETLPLEAHVVYAFRQAEATMNGFKTFQEKWRAPLRNQEKQDESYLLQGATKVNDIIAQATKNLDGLLATIQTWQKESEKEEIKAVPIIAKIYKITTFLTIRAIEEYAQLTQTIEAGDVQKIRCFLQEREEDQACLAERQTYLAVKPALCKSLVAYRERIGRCEKNLINAHLDNHIEKLEKADFCFNDAIQAISSHAQTLFEKAGDYYLQSAEEIANHGYTPKAEGLSNAAANARKAGEVFEKEPIATTPQGRVAYDRALVYDLQNAEERVTKGLDANNFIMHGEGSLFGAAAVAREAGKFFEKRPRTITSQGKGAYDEALNYYIQKAEEIATNGTNDKVAYLSSAVPQAFKAGEAFERAAKVTSSLAKVAFEKAGGYYLQSAEEIATDGNNDKARCLSEAASQAFKAGEAFEKAALLTASAHKEEASIVTQEAEYALKRADIYATKGIEAGDAFTFDDYLNFLDQAPWREVSTKEARRRVQEDASEKRMLPFIKS